MQEYVMTVTAEGESCGCCPSPFCPVKPALCGFGRSFLPIGRGFVTNTLCFGERAGSLNDCPWKRARV